MANGQESFTLEELQQAGQQAQEEQRPKFTIDQLRGEEPAEKPDTTEVEEPTETDPESPFAIRRAPTGQLVQLPFRTDSKTVNAIDSYVKGSQDAIGRGLKSASIATFDLTNFLRRQFGRPEVESTRDLPVFQFAKKVEEEVETAFPGNPELQGDFLSDQLPRMAGDMANQVLVGSALGWGGVALMGTTYASDEYEQALEAGSDEDEAFSTWLKNVPVGGLEALPIAGFFRRFNQLSGGSVSKVLKGGFVGGGENLIQEGASQFARNVIASGSYDKTRELTDGLVEQASVGGGVGFALNAVGLSFRVRARTDKNLTPTERAELQRAAEKAEDGAETANKIAGVGKVTIKETGETVSQQEFQRREQEWVERERKKQGVDKMLESEEGKTHPIENSVQQANVKSQKNREGFEEFDNNVVIEGPQKDSDSPGSMESGAPMVVSGERKNLSKNRFQRWFKEWFTSGGTYTEGTFNEKVARDGRVASQLEKVRFTARDLNKELIRIYAPDSKKGAWGFLSGRDIPKKVFNEIDLALRNQKDPSELPGDLPDIVSSMRDHIDGLSYQFIQKGIVSGKLEAKFMDNIGAYIHRQYEVHRLGEKWARDVKENQPELIERAEQHLISAYKKEHGKAPTELELKNMIDDILVGQYQGNLIYSNRQEFDKDFDLGPIMKRQDISPAIRKLMGEVRDPIQNYVDTVTNMSRILESRQMYQNWRQKFGGDLFYAEGDSRPEGFNYRIDAGNDPVLAPLDGMRTHKDIYDAMKRERRQEDLAPWLKTMLKFNSVAKYSKVIASHTTQIRNIVGGTKYMLRNGMFPKGQDFSRGFESVKEVFSNPSSPEARARLEHYSELGLRGKSPIGKEISEAIKDWQGGSFDTFDITRAVVDKGFKGPVRAAKITAKKASDLYKAGDDMLRIAFFEAELRRLQKADPNITEREVADRILDYYQNYDALPKAVQSLRRIPVISPFVAHSAEVIRTGFNTAWYARQEIQSNNPALQKIGYQRLVGLGASMTMSAAAALTMKNMLGIDEDMDEDIRRFAAPWDSNSTLLPLSYEDGKSRFINLSYIDIDEAIVDPILTLAGRGNVSEDDVVDRAANAVGQLMQPLLQEEIFFKAIREYSANERESGAQIYNPQDKIGNKVSDIFLHFWQAFEPGSISSAKRAYEGIMDEDKVGGGEDELMGLFGMRITGLDINQSLGFNTRDYRDKVREARRIYNRVRYQDDVTDEQERDALARSNEAYQELFQKIHGDFRAARRLGVSEQEIVETFDDSGLSKNEIKNIRLGRFQPFELAEEDE